MSFEFHLSDDLALGPARRGLRCRHRSSDDAFDYWSTAAARRRHLRGGDGPAPDLASLRLHLRPGSDVAELREAARIERAITTAHLRSVPVVGPPDVEADEVSDAAVSAELTSQALFGGGRKLLGRRRAARQTSMRAADVARERRARAASDLEADVDEAERHYAALVANEPTAVLGAVEAAFDHDDVPAAAVACEDGVLSLVLCVPEGGAIPPHRVAWPKPSKPVVADRTGAEAERLAVQVMASFGLAAMRRAAAAAPAIATVRLLAVRPEPARRSSDAVYAGTFDVVDRARWANDELDPVTELALASDSPMGRTDAVAPLGTADEPDIERAVKEVSAALYP